MFHLRRCKKTAINVFKYLQHLSTTERGFSRPKCDTLQQHLGTNDIATAILSNKGPFYEFLKDRFSEHIIADSDTSAHD